MKKTLFLMGFILLLSNGCKNDPLDITPDGRMTLDDIFGQEIRTEAYLNTVYSAIPTYYASYHFFAFLAGITDEAHDSDVGNESSSMANQWISGALTPSNDPTGGGYSAFWSGIRHANVFLDNIDEANVSTGNNKERFKAEARLLRAFYYLELVKKYGPLPVFDKPFESDFDYTSLVRPTFQQVTDFVVSDCDAAIASSALPIRITSAGERGRFTKAIAHAIKSQILLYNASPLWNPSNDRAKWVAAAEATQASLSTLTTGGQYRLASNYGEYFLKVADISETPNDRETIFERPAGFVANINSIPSKAGMMKAGSCPSQELVDSYDMQATGRPAILGYQDETHLDPIVNTASGYDPSMPFVGRDPRFYATVWYNGAQYNMGSGVVHTIQTYAGGQDQILKSPPSRRNTHTGYYLRKFINPTIPDNIAQDAGNWKKFRLAELYLNFAEAENEANGPGSAVYAAVNAVRNRSDMPDLPLGLNQEDMRQRIRNERRVEFAFEEHRFWDVRRWKILDKTDKTVTGMEPVVVTPGTFNYVRFTVRNTGVWQNRYLLFPLPIQDASIIPDFADKQNPGW